MASVRLVLSAVFLSVGLEPSLPWSIFWFMAYLCQMFGSLETVIITVHDYLTLQGPSPISLRIQSAIFTCHSVQEMSILCISWASDATSLCLSYYIFSQKSYSVILNGSQYFAWWYMFSASSWMAYKIIQLTGGKDSVQC